MSFVKVVKVTSEIEDKAKEFDSIINDKPRRLYTIKPNNLFGLKGGLVFTGLSLDKAVERVVDNCFLIAQSGIKDTEQRIEILRKIRKVAKAITLDCIIIGLNGKDRSRAWVETVYDVEKDESLRYSDLSYDKKINECYYYSLDKKDEVWID